MESQSINEILAVLVFQLGIIFFAVRFFGKLAVKIGIPQVLGELISGVIIGPYALGAIPIPGFPEGIFAAAINAGSTLPVSNELYAIASIGSVILLFVSGLETDIGLFLRYSVAGGLVGLGGVAASFFAGNFAGMILLNTTFMDPRCLFLGIISTATSLGITARILSDQKKMDSPEGVTILAAAVLDDVLGIIALAVLMGIVAVISLDSSGGGMDVSAILLIAGRAIGIWLGFSILGLLFSKKISGFLKFFKNSYDFSILALGLALLLAGIFEKQGLAMIIGACIAGLSLSKTDIAPVILEKIQGVQSFFVPVFFAVMGMMVNVREILSPYVLIFGAVYLGAAVLAKLIGCGGPAILLGFNLKGAMRIGLGMIPRGEVALILAGIGLAAGILNQQLFSIVILMTLSTTLISPPLLNLSLKIPGAGTRKKVKDTNTISSSWQFKTGEIANMIMSRLLRDLRSEGFYIQTMYIDEGLSQARKDDIIFSIKKTGSSIYVETEKINEPYIKTLVYEVIVEFHGIIQSLKDSSAPVKLKKELLDSADNTANTEKPGKNLLDYILPHHISVNLQGSNKEDVILSLIDMLAKDNKNFNREWILRDVLERERIMSTGMNHGIALPHARTDGVEHLSVVFGTKKEGVDFGSIDEEKSRLFVLIVSPRKDPEPYTRLLADIAAILSDANTREEIIHAESAERLMEIIRNKINKQYFKN